MLQLFLSLALVAQAPVQASAVSLKPTTLLELDLGKMQGTLLRQLAWSEDQTELYLQTYDANRDASIKQSFHYIIPVAGGAPQLVPTAPAWATAYWLRKSDQVSPDDPKLKIEPNMEKRMSAATAIPMGGEMAKGGVSDPATNGLSAEAAADAARQSTNAQIITLKLKGQIIGEWINHPAIPGLTFGWAPKGHGLIAYSEKTTGRLIIMDTKGARKKIDETKNVLLPAWTDDGRKLAYVERRSRSTWALIVADVVK